MKDCIKCPFKSNYSLIGKKTSIRKRVTNGNSGILPKVYYKVSISSTNPLHTCCLNTSYHRIAISNSGTFNIDPQKFNSIILELKYHNPYDTTSDPMWGFLVTQCDTFLF